MDNFPSPEFMMQVALKAQEQAANSAYKQIPPESENQRYGTHKLLADSHTFKCAICEHFYPETIALFDNAKTWDDETLILSRYQANAGHELDYLKQNNLYWPEVMKSNAKQLWDRYLSVLDLGKYINAEESLRPILNKILKCKPLALGFLFGAVSLEPRKSQATEDFLAMCANVPERPALAEPIEHNYGDLPLHKLQGPEERLLAAIGVALPEFYPPGVENLSQTEKNQVAYKKLQTIQERNGEILMWFTKAFPAVVRGVFWRQPKRIDDTWETLKDKLASGLFSNSSLRQVIELSVKETASGLIRNSTGLSTDVSKSFELNDLETACQEFTFLLLVLHDDPEAPQMAYFTKYDKQEFLGWVEHQERSDSSSPGAAKNSNSSLELAGYYKLTLAIYEQGDFPYQERVFLLQEDQTNATSNSQKLKLEDYENLLPFLITSIKPKLKGLRLNKKTKQEKTLPALPVLSIEQDPWHGEVVLVDGVRFYEAASGKKALLLHLIKTFQTKKSERSLAVNKVPSSLISQKKHINSEFKTRFPSLGNGPLLGTRKGGKEIIRYFDVK